MCVNICMCTYVCEREIARCEDIEERIHYIQSTGRVRNQERERERESGTWEAVTVKAPRNQRKGNVCVGVCSVDGGLVLGADSVFGVFGLHKPCRVICRLHLQHTQIRKQTTITQLRYN